MSPASGPATEAAGCTRIPVYLLYGRRDVLIPAEHSQQPSAVLLRAGWTDGTALFHPEIPEAADEVFGDCGRAAARIASVARFILPRTPQASAARQPRSVRTQERR